MLSSQKWESRLAEVINFTKDHNKLPSRKMCTTLPKFNHQLALCYWIEKCRADFMSKRVSSRRVGMMYAEPALWMYVSREKGVRMR